MSPSLAAVKAEIKTWERTFRAKHDRNPTREDIKARRDIADKYTLYKRLVKNVGEDGAGTSTTAGNGKDTTKKPRPARDSGKDGRSDEANRAQGSAQDGTSTAIIPQQETILQTPKKNKTSDRWRRPPTTETDNDLGDQPLLGGPEVVSTYNPFLSPAKKERPSPSQTNLGKAKAYATPISDPAYRNPFESDVIPESQHEGSRNRADQSTAVSQSPSKQAFLFAPSPKRLKSLLEVNSLHALSSLASPAKGATLPAITPRTRARKRLRGEEVDDTPEKERDREGKSLKIGSRWAQARSLRLQRSNGMSQDDNSAHSTTGKGGTDWQSVGRINVWKRDVQEESMPSANGVGDQAINQFDDDDVDEEIFGPTPIKATANGSFSGTATGKRLFLDILPPLEAPISYSTTVPVPATAATKSNDIDRVVDEDLDMKDPDIRDASDVTRTPSKAMSRFLDSKPRSLAPAQGPDHSTAMDIHLEPDTSGIHSTTGAVTSAHTGPQASDAKHAEHEASDNGYDDDDDDMVLPEAIDIDVFGTGLVEEEIQDERDDLQNALVREIILSDEEDGITGVIDEDAVMDGNDRSSTAARAGGRRLRIESNRYTLQQKVAQQRSGKMSDLFDDDEFEELREIGHKDVVDEIDDDDLRGQGFNTKQPEPFQVLSKLSIQSPESKVVLKTMALQQARARAIFDARAREQLRASKRAPVYGAGEGMGNEHDDDEEGMVLNRQEMVDPFVDKGEDDDWESEPEGWKATGLPDDDDW